MVIKSKCSPMTCSEITRNQLMSEKKFYQVECSQKRLDRKSKSLELIHVENDTEVSPLWITFLSDTVHNFSKTFKQPQT